MFFSDWWLSPTPKPSKPPSPSPFKLQFAQARLLDPGYRKYSKQEAEEALRLSRQYWRLHRRWLDEFSKEDRQEILVCSKFRLEIPEMYTQSKTWSAAQEAMTCALELEAVRIIPFFW
jgi:hypothetical protein